MFLNKSKISKPILFRVIGLMQGILNNFSFSERLFKKLKSKSIFFIHIGANDGISQDPIFNYSENWHGILIEPIAEPFKKLQHNFINDKKKILLNCAISTSDGEITLYSPKITERNKNFHTIITSAWNNSPYLTNQELESVNVKCLTLKTLIENYQLVEIDLLVTDVEDIELTIFNSYDFKIKPKVIYFETRFFSFDTITPFYEKMRTHGYSIYPEKDNCLMILE